MKSTLKALRTALAGLLILTASLAVLADDKMKPEDIVAKHLDSIGAKDARAKLKNAVGSGTSTFETLRRPGRVSGPFILASEGSMFLLAASYNHTNYPYERMSYNGKDVIAAIFNQGGRSTLGTFIYDNKFIVNNGLFGGSLSTGWALNNIPSDKVRLAGGGIKKIDGMECYVVDYEFKKGSDLKIKMFFAVDNFRHVRTEYTSVQSAQMGSAGMGSMRENTGANSASRAETRRILREDFSNYKEAGGLMLPHSYKIYQATSGRDEFEWRFEFAKFDFNQPLDPASFNLQSE